MNAFPVDALRRGISRAAVLASATDWARDDGSEEAPAIALAWTRGLLPAEWLGRPHGEIWRRASRTDEALDAMLAPLFALGLLGLPREERSAALGLAPVGLEAATRAAFLRVRGQARPSPAAVTLASGAWIALRRLQATPASPRSRAVSAAVSVLGSVLAWELDVLSDAPPILAQLRVDAAGPALAAWWLAQLQGVAP